MTNFSEEKENFRSFYDRNRLTFEVAKDRMIVLLEALLSDSPKFTITKVEGRVKDREECIAKFTRKYREQLETDGQAYSIADHISDLLGVRVVCLYENEVERIVECLNSEFLVASITDKSSDIESTEGSFGYKGVHVDLSLSTDRKEKQEYSAISPYSFEVQVRSIIQDAWSAIDHKIKYKKSIPQTMKRRVNLLAAMFELADREFLAIKDLTEEAKESKENDFERIASETASEGVGKYLNLSLQEIGSKHSIKSHTFHPLNAFSFLRIANHFFPDFEFEDFKVDGFVDRITDLYPGISRGRFNYYMRETIARVKEYKSEMAFELNPYTVMRHCLYLADPNHFTLMLNDDIRSNFKNWMEEKELKHVVEVTSD